MKRLFPRTHTTAAYVTLSDAIRRKEGTADPRSGLLSLFFLGGQREALIAQEEPQAPAALVSARPENGDALAKLLLEAYEPVLGNGYLERSGAHAVNEARSRVDVGSVRDSHLDEAHLKAIVGALIAGLRFSSRGRYLPPVVRLERIDARSSSVLPLDSCAARSRLRAKSRSRMVSSSKGHSQP